MNRRILYFFDFGKSFGGAVNTLMHQMFLARKAGYEVYGFVSSYGSSNASVEYLKIFRENGIELERLDYPLCSHTENLDIVGVLECYESVKAAVLQYKPMLMHSVQINPTVELVSRELKIPHIMDIYQSHPDFFSIPYINIFPQYHICDSECYAKTWSEGLGIRSTCIRTVVKEHTVRTAIEDKEYLTLICVGIVSKRKNQLEVIKGFHNALKRGVKGKLYLYGYDVGAYAEECRNYVRGNEIESYVKICGFTTSMESVYEKADVLVCGSRTESYPNVISEALANGVIIVSSPVAGVPEVIKDGMNGYLSKGYLAKDFEEKIVQCYYDFKDGSISNILNNANDTFLQVHSKAQVTKQLINFYEMVMKQSVENERMDITELRLLFQDWIKKYLEYEKTFSYPEYIRKKIWYMYHMRMMAEKQPWKKKKIYIWGTGKLSNYVMEMWNVFFEDMKIEGFIDSYKQGGHLGYSIKKPEEVIYDMENIVLVALSNGADEVLERLKQASRTYGKDFFFLGSRSW